MHCHLPPPPQITPSSETLRGAYLRSTVATARLQYHYFYIMQLEHLKTFSRQNPHQNASFIKCLYREYAS